MRILLVEDDEDLSEALVQALRGESYAVDPALDGPTASELHFVNSYDLVVLDWTIPPPTGLELLGEWRRQGDETPVLMLTARQDVEDRVDGLDMGADDYLTKPFSLVEFLARVRSLLRRVERPLRTVLEAGELAMDRSARKVELAGAPLALSRKEYALLEYLLLHKDQVVSRADLAEHVWDDSFDPMSNVVDVTLHRLRKKVDGGNDCDRIETVVGVGYRLKSRSV
jgi:DNA-binding response OmpR family regulator